MGNSFGRIALFSDKKQREIFDKYDADKSGTCSFEELLVMMEELNLGTKDPKANEKFLADYLASSMADENHDGELDFKEFQVFCKAAGKAQKAEQKSLSAMSEIQLLDVFHKYDTDHNGTLSKDEVLAMMKELNLGMDNPEENPEFLDAYLKDSGADKNNNGRIDFGEFKIFARYARVNKDGRKAVKKTSTVVKKRRASRMDSVSPSPRSPGGGRVTPAESRSPESTRAAKRTAGVGQSAGYSPEALELLRKKKEARAREMAEVAARNAAATREQRKRIKQREQEAAERTRKSMENKEHFKKKKQLDAAHQKDLKAFQKATRQHEKEYAKLASKLDAGLDEVKKQQSISRSKMNLDYEKRKQERDAMRTRELREAEQSRQRHERAYAKKAAELDAMLAAVKEKEHVDPSQMNQEYAARKAERDAERQQAILDAEEARRQHERAWAKTAAELDATIAEVKKKQTVDSDQMNTEYEQLKQKLDEEHKADLEKQQAAIRKHEAQYARKSAALDKMVAEVRKKEHVDADQMNQDYYEKKALLDAEHQKDLAMQRQARAQHEREHAAKVAELDAEINDVKAQGSVVAPTPH
eukprot:m.148284 g.148284  ORF g.148284 m.148284 type:complete len:586 (-) comp14206_c0_seq1:197-1954(-)